MTNDQFFLFPILSYGNKNTVGAVARLFFSDPPFAPHATTGIEYLPNGMDNGHGYDCIEVGLLLARLGEYIAKEK